MLSRLIETSELNFRTEPTDPKKLPSEAEFCSSKDRSIKKEKTSKKIQLQTDNASNISILPRSTSAEGSTNSEPAQTVTDFLAKRVQNTGSGTGLRDRRQSLFALHQMRVATQKRLENEWKSEIIQASAAKKLKVIFITIKVSRSGSETLKQHRKCRSHVHHCEYTCSSVNSRKIALNGSNCISLNNLFQVHRDSACVNERLDKQDLAL